MNRVKDIQSQRGVGLLEVLIALLVLAIGVLGFAGLQMTALSQSHDANYRVAAVLVAQDAIERMELNLAGRGVPIDPTAAAGSNEYLSRSWGAASHGGDPASTCLDRECSATDMVGWDIAQLTWQAANQLPLGRVLADECSFNSNLICVVVSWDGQDPAGCMDGGVNVDVDSKCVVMEVAR